jgi:hypothetical protein
MKRFKPARSAWIASGFVHLLLVAGLWKFGESRSLRGLPEVPTVAATEENPFTMTLEKDEEPRRIHIRLAEPVKPAIPETTTPKPSPPQPDTEHPPLATDSSTPKPAPKPLVPVVDVVQNLQAGTVDVSPLAKFPTPSVSPHAPAGPPRFSEGQPLHGLLPDGRKAVYLIDRSASMGLVYETFEASKAALFKTIQGTRPGAPCQALAYSSDVSTLLGGARSSWLKMEAETALNLRKTLALLNAEGRSRHDTALRAALALEPDYVIWITDADESELALLKAILKGHRKPVAVYLCRAGGGKVAAPVEWK